MQLCEYGCGQEANFKLKNKKWCCSKSSNSCSAFREKLRKARLGRFSGENHPLWGKKFSEESKERMSKSHKGIPNKMKGKTFSEETRNNMIGSHEGCVAWNKGLKTGPLKDETKRKLSLSHKGRIVPDHVREFHRQRMLNGGAKHAVKFIKKESWEKKRQWMLNGGAVYLIKHIKSPSKPEVKLREIVKELYPSCEYQYQVLNYAIDVVIPEYRIAIEFDGYYHFCNEEVITYHNKRHKEIENQGFILLRYDIYHNSHPTKEQIEKDIITLIKEG